MRLIDYLKEKFLNELGFSEDTFILPDLVEFLWAVLEYVQDLLICLK